MALAGHAAKVLLSANGTDYVEADGISQADLNHSINLLDANYFKNSDTKKRICGMQDHTLDISGDFAVDATSQGLCRSLGRAGSAIWWKVLADGTNGYGVTVASTGDLVASFKMGATTEGKVTFSCQIQANAAIEEIGTAD
jgi:predicted secreted protein